MKEILMVTNCAEAKHLIHLDVGDDLRVEEELQLATHMQQCGDCRSYHADMSRSMNTLLTVRNAPAFDSLMVTSVWPLLSRELARRHTSPRVARKFNMQVVALSVSALSLAVVTMVQSLSSMRNDQNPTGVVPGLTVSESSKIQQLETVDDNAGIVRAPFYPHEAIGSQPVSF